ncbi:MAG: hypothetical protein DI603_06710 [Roseateles depolymerans]|uniref:Uncharacterized protein n=1 Tax=Roseateles depolymerans TaxID=76731 RepID=A0A2W5DST9_9BURK|nr:MAG: hypothetical protein DI603_06710 [Roseateles depolymerans]
MGAGGFAAGSGRLSGREWLLTFDDLGLRIVQLAVICNVRLAEPGVVERLLQPLPGRVRPAQRAHQELCGLLHLFFRQQRRMLEQLGPVSATLLRERLVGELQLHGLELMRAE